MTAPGAHVYSGALTVPSKSGIGSITRGDLPAGVRYILPKVTDTAVEPRETSSAVTSRWRVDA